MDEAFDGGLSTVDQGTEGRCLALLLVQDLPEFHLVGLKGDFSLGWVLKTFLKGVQVRKDDVEFMALNVGVSVAVGQGGVSADYVLDARFDDSRPECDVPLTALEAAIAAVKDTLQAGDTGMAELRIDVPEWATITRSTVFHFASVAILWP